MEHTKRLTGLALALSCALMSAGVFAAAISGKDDLVCAVVDVIGCTDGNCVQGRSQTFEMPAFMFVDVKRKLVHATDKAGKEVSSPIKNFEITETSVILQGIENHRGWTLGVDRGAGGMSLSSVGEDVSFMIFGNCTQR